MGVFKSLWIEGCRTHGEKNYKTSFFDNSVKTSISDVEVSQKIDSENFDKLCYMFL